MKNSKIIKLKFSELSNKKELFYREETQQKENNYNDFSKWKKNIQDGRIKYLRRITQKVRFYGNILEIGAGSSWFSCELSKLSSVKKIHCLDFSEKILNEITPLVMDYLKADKKKMVRVVGDFYNLNFKDKSFDMVVVDAALHHIDNMNHVLSEIKRVLKDGGMIVAIREPIVPKLRPGCKNTFGAHERSLGLTENIFSKKEWTVFFKKNGFTLKFLPIIPEYSFKYKIINRTILKGLNGLLFAHYVLIAKKKRIKSDS